MVAGVLLHLPGRVARGWRWRLLLILTLGALAWPAAAVQLPTFEQVRAGHVSSEGRLVDRHGAPLSEIRLDSGSRRLEWMSLRELSPAMLEALLAAEDRRFYQHGGVDWRAVAGALWQNLWYDRTRGASTLSMQLAGLLDPELRPDAAQGGRRTLGQKWDQARAASALEASWSKEQILEAYLNLAPFRGELSGLPAAAWGLFRQTPSTLGRAQAAVLAVLLRGPNAAPALVARRACHLVRVLSEPEACPEAEGLAARLSAARFEPRWNLAPELARRLLRQPGEVLPTTLVREVQLLAQAAVAAGRARGVVVLDNPSAEVLALAQAPGTEALEAPGSLAEQAVLYGLALERQLITPASLLPLSETGEGWVSARTGLATGLPGPAEFLLRQVGLAALEERLRGLVPHGSVGDLLALAGLVRPLGSGGLWFPPRLTPGDAPAGRRLLRPEVAFLVADMLHAGPGRGLLGGAGAAVAFDAELTVAVARGGADSARELALALLAGMPQARGGVRPPPELVQHWVSFEPAVELPRQEWFLKGSEVALGVPLAGATRILWPAREAVVDVRGQISDPAFMLTFQARPGRPDLVWVLNGAEIGRGSQVRWRPEGGLVHLELLDGAGRGVAQVTFAVRGP